jgi:hypothetical protein
VIEDFVTTRQETALVGHTLATMRKPKPFLLKLGRCKRDSCVAPPRQANQLEERFQMVELQMPKLFLEKWNN